MAEATIAVYKELIRSSNILIIKLTAIGDVVLSTAAFKAIRHKYPNARIYCLTSPQAASVIETRPHINEVIVFDYQANGLKGLLHKAQELRRHHFDKVIDLQNNRVSHLLSFLSIPKESYGYDNGKFSFLLSKKIKNNIRNIPPVEHQFRILKILGIDYDPELKLELFPSLKDEAYVQELLDGEWLSGPHVFVGLNISASQKWPTKNWPVEHMAKLCDILGQKNIRVILTGENKDKALSRQLIAKARSKPASFVGKTNILQLAALIKRCQAYISPDSAPLHVAASMQVPIIALFGPTDPVRHMPPAEKQVILNKPMKCSPCYSNVCKIKTHACMVDISPEEVARKVVGMIKG
jgi:lipopolysaccharide heptosyltransferase II